MPRVGRTKTIQAGEHFGGIRHAREVRVDVDRVRDEKGEGRDDDQPFGEFEAQRSRKSAAGDHPDARAHELHATHERPGDERGPKQRRAVLRTGHRVSRDAGRIIIRCAGDQAGAELAEKSRDGVFRFRFFRRGRRSKRRIRCVHFSTNRAALLGGTAFAGEQSQHGFA